MYVNAKMIPVETIPGLGGRGMKESGGGGELIYCKNFYKCHNVNHPAHTYTYTHKDNFHFYPKNLCKVSLIWDF
jgi:hypothetical protein